MLEDAGKAVEATLDGKQGIDLVLIQQATVKIEVEEPRAIDTR